MPPEQFLRPHEKTAKANLRHQTAQPSEDRTIGWPQRRAIDLVPQDLHFVPQNDDLNRQFIAIGAPVTEQLEHPYERQVEEGQRDSPPCHPYRHRRKSR
jgi:hypothetical protein